MAPCPLIGSDQPALWHLDAARGPSTPSFDHLVGAGEKRGWYVQAERLGGLEVDYQLVLGRCLHGQVGWLLALEDAVDIGRRAPVLVDPIRTIRDQAAIGDKDRVRIDGGQFVPGCKPDDQIAMDRCKRAAGTIRPPFEERANAVTVRSISACVIDVERGSPPPQAKAPWTEQRRTGRSRRGRRDHELPPPASRGAQSP